jgi:hypothetical protein
VMLLYMAASASPAAPASRTPGTNSPKYRGCVGVQASALQRVGHVLDRLFERARPLEIVGCHARGHLLFCEHRPDRMFPHSPIPTSTRSRVPTLPVCPVIASTEQSQRHRASVSRSRL